jgi:hypothetical protein
MPYKAKITVDTVVWIGYAEIPNQSVIYKEVIWSRENRYR